MAAAWPGRAGDPFADRMNAIPKYVVSSTPRRRRADVGQHHAIPGERGGRRIRELRAEGGDLLVMGSSTLVAPSSARVWSTSSG